MLSFRKIALAVATLGLSAVGAYAQSCTVTSVPLAIRPEGITEQLGDITLNCSNLVNASATVLVTVNGTITNSASSPAVNAVATPGPVTGVLNSAIANSVSFALTGLTTGASTTQVITIGGIRVNASLLTPNTAVSATIIVTSGPTVLPLSPNPTTVGYVLPASYTFTVVGGTVANVSATSSAAALASLPICSSTASVSGFFRFTELFSSVFRAQASEGPGSLTNGTQLRVILGNIPSGVGLWVPTGAVTLNNGVVLTLASGTGTTAEPTSNTLNKTYTAPETGAAVYTGTFGLVNASELVFNVTTDNVNTVDQLNIPFIVRFSGSPTNGVGTATAQGSLGPTAAGTFPRFATTGATANAFNTVSCATSLLFPFVTNAAGFDTGLAISNTTADGPLFTTSSQTGVCSVNYYGDMEDGGALPTTATTSPVAGGRSARWSMSAGGWGVAAVRAGFTGYVIAQCTFQLAHGYAFVSDLGARTIAHGYLALVLGSDSGSRTAGSSTREALNN